MSLKGWNNAEKKQVTVKLEQKLKGDLHLT